MTRLLMFFFGQGVNYLLVVINIRACAKGLITLVMLTDFVFCLIGFTFIKYIATAHSFGEMLAYALGGACGSACAILLTRRWDKT